MVKEKKVEKPTRYAWVVLVCIIGMAICNQWQRYAIGYAKGFKVDKEDTERLKNIDKYQIGSAYPDFATYYGVLSGPAFALSFSITGIFAGVISDNSNRKLMAGGACVLWSVTTLLTGVIDSFPLMFVFRFLLGIFEGVYNPCAYSIMADYFPPEYRGTANSLFNGAIYLGGALSSLAVIMISAIGWRWTYNVMGIAGAAAGVIGLLFIREPVRGRFDAPKAAPVKQAGFNEEPQAQSTLQKFLSASAEVCTNPTCRNVTIAASLRFTAGYAIGFFMPSYFQGVWP